MSDEITHGRGVDERRAGMRNVIDMLAAGKLHPRIYARVPLGEASA